MHHLSELLDVDKVNELVRQGFISCRPHPTLDLVIYNYTPKTTYANAWTDETIICRGLVVNSDGYIIARPLPKIKSIHEYEDQSFLTKWEVKRVQEKVDGSLGTLVHYDGEVFITTRGSFESEQAKWATKHLNTTYKRFVDVVRSHPETFHYTASLPITFCFEIVYPQNRIVVDYGATKDLFLLCGISIESGMSFFPEQLHEWTGPCAQTFTLDGNPESPMLIHHAINEISKNEDNTEGLVVTFNKPRDIEGNYSVEHFRVKMKTAKYIELSRLMTYLDKKSVWESLSTGASLSDNAKVLEGNVFDWINEQEVQLYQDFKKIDKQAFEDFCIIRDSMPENATRKDWADKINKTTHPHLLYSMLDEKDYSTKIWKMLEPRGEDNVIYGSYQATEE